MVFVSVFAHHVESFFAKPLSNAKDRHVILAYMDETGTSVYTQKDKSKFFTRSCVLVPENCSKQIEAAIRQLLPTERANRVPFNVKLQEPCCFSAKDIYWGHEGWEMWGQERRKQLLHDVAALIIGHQLPTMFGHLNKPLIKARYGEP